MPKRSSFNYRAGHLAMDWNSAGHLSHPGESDGFISALQVKGSFVPEGGRDVLQSYKFPLNWKVTTFIWGI